MEITVEYLDQVRFAAEARGHRVLCDQPPENGGADSAMTPPEYLLTSLGTCAGFYAVQYLRTRGLPAEGLRVVVNAEKARHPARVGSFQIEVIVPNLDPEHEAGVLRAVKGCLVHNTLLNAPAIDTVVHSAAMAE